MKFTKLNLNKIEEVFKDLNYTLRYEKGSFQSGYCLVDEKKIIVINKFYDIEGRMNVLLDILSFINVDSSLLSDSSSKTFEKLKKEFDYFKSGEEE